MHISCVAVVSANPTFLRFFSLECQLFGCEVYNFSKMPSRIDTYDRVFVDSDTVKHYGTNHERIIVVSSQNACADAHRLPWPTATAELADLLCGRLESEPSLPEAPAEPILWIQSRESRELRYEWKTVELSQSEMLLLKTLAREEKKTVSRATLMRLFGAETGNIADVYVCHLRKKLEQLCDRRVIVTVRGVGYRLELSVREAEEE